MAKKQELKVKTHREEYALEAMKAVVSGRNNHNEICAESIADHAVKIADALLERLKKPAQ